MNSRDRFDNNISFMFKASNISWHIIMKARITITAFDKDKNEAKGKKKTEETESDSNLIRTMNKLNLRTETNHLISQFLAIFSRYMSRINLVSKNLLANYFRICRKRNN